jgi:hypothetical protein
MQHLRVDLRVQLKSIVEEYCVMPKKLVDVFDKAGTRLFTYSIGLEEHGCLDVEFEEVALIFAESSGLVVTADVVHLRACCAPCADESKMPAIEAAPKRRSTPKSTVLSMVKHRMKKAASAATAHRARQVS